MADRRALAELPDAGLETALRELGGQLAWPAAPADLATGVRVRLAESPGRRRFGGPLDRLGLRRPVRRGLVLALVLLLAAAVVAGAVGLGLPGLRIILGGAVPSLPVASGPPSGAPGSTFGLGTPTTLAAAEAEVGFELALPPDPAIGPPAAVYVIADRVALAWAPSSALPDAEGDGVGLLISQFDGHVDEGYIEKLIDSGTTVTPVRVGPAGGGYWIAGGPHFFRYIDADGRDLEDTHRAVGDTLVWMTGGRTFRIESSLGLQANLALARSLAGG